jgi:hypothetical protein
LHCFFQTFLGQKYGYAPFPSKISSVHFEELIAATPDTIDAEMLKLWFKLDENFSPMPHYTMVPITENISKYNSEDPDERKEVRLLIARDVKSQRKGGNPTFFTVEVKVGSCDSVITAIKIIGEFMGGVRS